MRTCKQPESPRRAVSASMPFTSSSAGTPSAGRLASSATRASMSCNSISRSTSCPERHSRKNILLGLVVVSMSGARGTLRIYLGAAPGVGKTFAMLGEGLRRAERGTDVVVGFVETHGRPHTAEAIADLEVIPRRIINYRGSDFTEMDVDAILARHPKVALVDELAHTNVPGSRNEKRWQDVEELLTSGIIVLSTVNIQHLESLNDVVEKITEIGRAHV